MLKTPETHFFIGGGSFNNQWSNTETSVTSFGLNSAQWRPFKARRVALRILASRCGLYVISLCVCGFSSWTHSLKTHWSSFLVCGFPFCRMRWISSLGKNRSVKGSGNLHEWNVWSYWCLNMKDFCQKKPHFVSLLTVSRQVKSPADVPDQRRRYWAINGILW